MCDEMTRKKGGKWLCTRGLEYSKIVAKMQAQLLLFASISPYEALNVRMVVVCFCNLNRSSNFQPLSLETVDQRSRNELQA